MDQKKKCNRLNKAGIRNTKHANEVLDVMEKYNNAPMTVEDIYLKLKEKSSTINLSTVYRILEKFVSCKLATRTNQLSDSKSVYELTYMEHRHSLVCIGCNKKVLIKHCPIDAFEKSMEVDTGFQIKGHRLELYGYCPECIKKMKNK